MKIIDMTEAEFKPDMLSELTPEELAEAYKLAREAFTAQDLQRFTEVEEGTPMEEVLAEMEEVQKQFDEKPK